MKMDRNAGIGRALLLLAVIGLGVTREAMAQAVGDAFHGTNPAAVNFFLGKTAIGTNAVTGPLQLYVLGNARMDGSLTVEGPFRVARQGDLSMSIFTNGDPELGLQGIGTSNVALRGAWISYGGENSGLYVTPDGRVGIGTDSGLSALTVVGAIQSTSGGFIFPDGSIQARALAFTNQVGDRVYVDTGLILAPGVNLAHRYENGTNFLDGASLPAITNAMAGSIYVTDWLNAPQWGPAFPGGATVCELFCDVDSGGAVVDFVWQPGTASRASYTVLATAAVTNWWRGTSFSLTNIPAGSRLGAVCTNRNGASWVDWSIGYK